MLVVQPAAARFDAADMPAMHEEHLLERVSALENRLTRVSNQLEKCLEFVLLQTRNTHFDRELIGTLIGALSESALIDAEKIDAIWKDRCERIAAEHDEGHPRNDLQEEIIARYDGEERRSFQSFVDEGMSDLSEGNVTRGVHALERAAALAVDNVPLNLFLGEHFFRSGKMKNARDYLDRALLASPQNDRVCLLLGLACGDDGESKRAKQLLREVIERGGNCFAAHYALGRLLVAEERWANALGEFKRALKARPSPETHYVVGCVYYRLNQNRMAARHLNKAIEMNNSYSAALYMLGLVYLRLGDEQEAENAFNAARAAGQDESRYHKGCKGCPQPNETPAIPPLFSAARQARKRLVTSGDRRLAEAVLEDALSAEVQRLALRG